MPEVGDIFYGRDVGMKGYRYIMVRCPDCPEGQNTRLAPYSKNSNLCTTVRRCQRHNKRHREMIYRSGGQ